MPENDLPRGLERGFQEIENNPFIIDDPDDRVGLADVEDIDGVGPATARKLEDAGIEEPADLYGLEQDEIAAVDGIGPKRAATLRSEVLQRGNRDESSLTFREDAVDKARDQHAERSPEERRADESFNADIALSYNKWRDAPGQYDMPGVDTIPRDRRLERTRAAAGALSDAGVSEEIEATPSGPRKSGVSGRAAGGRIEVKTAQNDPESTVAHELGHQFDRLEGGRASVTQKLFGGVGGEADDDETEQLRQEGARLASRRRSVSLKEDVIVDRAEDRRFGGGGFDEVLADAFAEAVEEPRRARKEAPELTSRIEQEYPGILPGRRS